MLQFQFSMWYHFFERFSPVEISTSCNSCEQISLQCMKILSKPKSEIPAVNRCIPLFTNVCFWFWGPDRDIPLSHSSFWNISSGQYIFMAFIELTTTVINMPITTIVDCIVKVGVLWFSNQFASHGSFFLLSITVGCCTYNIIDYNCIFSARHWYRLEKMLVCVYTADNTLYQEAQKWNPRTKQNKANCLH